MRFLKPHILGNGYLGVQFGRKSKCHLIHRLVAEAFIPNPKCKPQVNHLDGDRSNNCVSNLEWVTVSENHKHSYANLKRKPHGLSIAVAVGDKIFKNMCDAAEFLNVAPSSVASALSRKHLCRGLEVTRV